MLALCLITYTYSMYQWQVVSTTVFSTLECKLIDFECFRK